MKKTFLLRDIDAELHKQLKLAAVNAGISLQEFIIRALRKAVPAYKPSKH